MARQRIELALEEAEELGRRTRATTVSVGGRRRAEIIVLSAQDLTQQRIAGHRGLHPDKTGTAPRFPIDTPELRGATIQWLTPEGRRAHGTRHRRSRRVEGLCPPAQR